ncbi:MAG: DUF962 domain-containing protein [Siphonobacter sp.]
MPSLQSLLTEYGESHQNAINKRVHFICVPALFFSIVGLLYGIKLPLVVVPDLQLNVAIISLAIVWMYYLQLSRSIAIGMLGFSLFCLWLSDVIEKNVDWPLWSISLIIFGVAWIGQFWGHKIEGKKPSFFKDLQFLLIGPAWIMHFLFQKLGLKY